MVFILDEGSVFNGPLDKVWKLNASEGQHNHPSLRNMSSEMDGERVVLKYESKMKDGTYAKEKVRLTFYPPVGTATEVLEGPRAGSKSFQFYIPKGSKTGITVVGDFKSPTLSDSDLKFFVMQFLDTVFNEDQKNLAKV